MSPVETTGTCRACGAPTLVARMPSGRLNRLDAQEVLPEVGKGVVAYNPNTQRGMPVTFANLDACPSWAQQGWTFHISHFATCPERERFKRAETAASGEGA